MALGAGCDWNSSLEATPYPTCHVSMDHKHQNFMENHRNLWFSKTSKPTSANNLLAAFATRIHDFSDLFSPQLRTHRSCRSFITGSEIRDLQKTWPAGRKNSQQRCGQAPQSHRLRWIWAAISRCFWMFLDDFG